MLGSALFGLDLLQMISEPGSPLVECSRIPLEMVVDLGLGL